MSSLRVAVIGAGRRGTAHSEAVADLESRARVVGIADIDAERAQSLVAASAPHASPYTDASKLLQETRPDVVYVTTPPAFHRLQTIEALELGAHVVLEKPIALSIEDAESIVEVANRTGLIVHVCHQLRYIPGVAELRELLSNQRVALTHIWNYRKGPDIRGNWNRSWGGGHVVEWGIHYLDLCRYLMSAEATEVHARYADVVLHGHPDWDNWDVYGLNAQWSNGAVCSYASTYALKPGIEGSSGLTIVAGHGKAEIEWAGCRWVTPEGASEWTGERGDAEVKLSQTVFDAIETGDRSSIRQTFEDAMKTHELVMGANQSAMSGMPVSLHPSATETTVSS